jgi:hypothetical protein
VTDVDEHLPGVVTVRTALVLPLATVMVVGMIGAELLLLDKVTTAPPFEGGPLSFSPFLWGDYFALPS